MTVVYVIYRIIIYNTHITVLLNSNGMVKSLWAPDKQAEFVKQPRERQ